MSDRSNTSDGQKPVLVRVAALLIGVFIGVGILEIGVRMWFPHYTPDIANRHSIPYEQRVYTPYTIAPANRLIDIDSNKAWGGDGTSDSSIFISSNGYRGPAFDVRKPVDSYRVIVIGGSAVFDQNVFDTPDSKLNSWPNRVQTLLAQKGFAHVEVINAGIPGQSSADSLGRFFGQLWTYDPDMVIVYHGWNDFKSWHRMPVSPETPLIDRILPTDPADNPFTHYQGIADRILSFSQLYVKLRTRYFAWRWEPNYEGAVPKSVEMANGYGSFGPRQHYLNLSLLVAAATTVGAQPVLIKQATLVSSDNSPEDRNRILNNYVSLEHDAIVRAYRESYRTIDRIAFEREASVIDPTEAMNGRSELFTDHVHLTPTGSRELAGIVAANLELLAAPFTTH
jgi:lysophospholipase L1-like esterase